ncbi:MAG: ACP S-malonyltransferase [Campylobacteraceae bacterium]
MNKKIAYVFPGQGSQFIGMGKDFYENSSLAKDMFTLASDRLKIDMKSLLFEENDKLNETEYSQPAIFLVSAIAYKLFENSLSIKPSFALGHSLGEFGALFSVKALGFLDGIELVRERGLLMKQACEGKNAGMMVLLGLSDEKVEEICKDAQGKNKQIFAANYNNDGQIVIAGTKSDLEEYTNVFKDAGAKRAMLLPMSVASHCPLLASAQKPLREKMQIFLKNSFDAPVISNVTASAYDKKDEALNLLAEQLIKPVKYKQSILNNPADIYVEFGASVLKGLNKKISSAPTLSIIDMASLKEAVETLK